MFEYLMPSLVMRAPVGSLLEQTNRLVVERQESYGRSLGIPWGVSESAYNARDMELTYQYSNFGVPGLGLKRGLSENVVIAPYATGLASMVDPHGALQNYARLADTGRAGAAIGFYEALDFTRFAAPRRRGFRDRAQLHGASPGHDRRRHREHSARRRDAARFHREPMIQASELLLQERMPRDVAVAHPRAEEVKASPATAGRDAPAVRRFAIVG